MSDDNPESPDLVAVFGEAVAPVAAKLRRRMDEAAHGVKPMPDIFDLSQRHLDAITQASERLEKEVVALNQACIQESVAMVHHGVGRLDACIEALLEHYDELHEIDPSTNDSKVRELLIGAWHHRLSEVLAWLDNFTEFSADPVAWLEKRGMPTSGDVEVPIGLAITAPPGMEELVEVCRQRSREIIEAGQRQEYEEEEPDDTIEIKISLDGAEFEQHDTRRYAREPEEPRLGFLGHVAAVLLGVGLADFLFLDDD